MSIVAIPIYGDRVSSRLDCAERFLIATLEDGHVCNRQEVFIFNCNPMERIRLLLRQGVDVMICGGLTETCTNILRDTHIEVISWVRGEVEEVLSKYVHGTLRAATPQKQ